MMMMIYQYIKSDSIHNNAHLAIVIPHREAEALVQVSLIASRLDSLMNCLLQAASQAAVRVSLSSPCRPSSIILIINDVI